MYLRHIRLTNIKGFRDLELSFDREAPNLGGWYVILGENGIGKSTLLREIALALAGRERSAGLLPDAEGWVTDGLPHGSCCVGVQLTDPAQRVDIEYNVNSQPFDDKEHGFVSRPSVLFKKISSDLAKRLYSVNNEIVVAGYGPFRHLAEPSSVRAGTGRGADPLTSLFYPAPLTECEEWLKRLDYTRKSSNDPDAAADTFFAAVVGVLNQLLPPPFKIKDVGPQGIVFSGPGTDLSLNGLSDGYRTMFGLGVDLMRRSLEATFSTWNLFVRGKGTLSFNVDGEGTPSLNLPGVVLIDEAEAHLHPKWQREIGFYLKRAFPRVQFIVATHSPFVAQAATHDGIFILEW